ncbi:MAG: AzlD family protein [Beijerinckiaceae bacterium]
MNDLWSVSPATLTVILLATAVTYLCRAGGHFVVSFFKPSRRVEKALAALPGCIIVSIVLPIVARTGVVAACAVIAAIVAMALRRSEILALCAGMVVAIGLRTAGF